MPNALDLWLTAAIGFLGSFGHCVGMCGPLTVAFSLSFAANEELAANEKRRVSQLKFHLLLNIGRLASYALVGAAIGGLGAVLLASGQMVGVGSVLRRSVSVGMGGLLIWFGLTQASPGLLPTLPFLHPALQQGMHERISQVMMRVSGGSQALMPLLLGLLWGLIPCGFLYTGQLRAIATQSWLGGMVVMLAFGLGTLPAMVTTGVVTSALSSDRRSQLFRLGGWMTVIIGILLLLRTGDTMSDYSGHAALFCLMAALIARPISRLWPALLRYRRAMGVGSFALSSLHILHMFSHAWNWNWQAVQFMLPTHQIGIWLGAIAFLLILPAALTSFDLAQKTLGNRWRKIHLLGVPALLLAAIHMVLTGSHYWGALALSWQNQASVAGLGLAVVAVMGLRSPQVWTLFSQAKHYAPPRTASLRTEPPKTEPPKTESPKTSPHPPSASDCCQSSLPLPASLDARD